MGFWSNLFSNKKDNMNNDFSSNYDDEDEDEFDNDYENDYENDEEESYDCYCDECRCGLTSYDNYVEFDGNIFCESCAASNELATCDECGNTFPLQRLEYDEYSGNYYCEDCRERDIPDYDSNGNSDYWREE